MSQLAAAVFKLSRIVYELEEVVFKDRHKIAELQSLISSASKELEQLKGTK
jgi:hypothetical protein